MGKQYVVADQMYASNFDASSFISHQYIIAGQAESSVNYPFGAWGCPGGSGDQIQIVGPKRQIPYGYEQACFGDNSLGEEADEAGISWAYYAVSYSGSAPAFGAPTRRSNTSTTVPTGRKTSSAQPSQVLTTSRTESCAR